METVDLLDNSVLRVKAGTQLIDGWWRVLRKELRNLSKATTAGVKRSVKAAQWKTWHRGEDLWIAMGCAIQRSYR
eukprot:15696880-Heterocapsa_arctica.AAC.1